ncbi:MAG: hypothetical protein KF729_38835 [Sandaracinaceae bacterium]|nr:hypothetical protein [Sandaracinaceae bacterium]
MQPVLLRRRALAQRDEAVHDEARRRVDLAQQVDLAQPPVGRERASAEVQRVADQLWLAVERRAASAIDPIALHLVGDDDDGDLHLELLEADHERTERDLGADVLCALAERPRTRTELRAHLGVRNERLGFVLTQLADDRRIERRDGLWSLVPDSAP